MTGRDTSCSHNCPLCGAVPEFAFTAMDYNLKTSPEDFDYFRCPACRCFFLHPVPDDPGKYYPADYPAYEIGGNEAAGTPSTLESEKLAIVKKHVREGRLLEIGPGAGNFARLANESGFRVETIEMDERCSRYLRDRHGIPSIHCSDPLSALSMSPSYDVIALWHVLEHLPDPSSIMEGLSAHLNPGGIIVLTSPNPESAQFELFGRHWAHLDAPRHLVLIPMSFLLTKGERLGLESAFLSTKDRLSRYLGGIGWFLASYANTSMGRRLPGAKTPKGAFLRIVRVLKYLLLFFPLSYVQGKGNAYTIVFRKKPSS